MCCACMSVCVCFVQIGVRDRDMWMGHTVVRYVCVFVFVREQRRQSGQVTEVLYMPLPLLLCKIFGRPPTAA